ncbi:MAG: flagellar brake protein [Bacillota bacterium]
MTLRDIQIGTRLELDVLNNKGEKTGRSYVSQILEHRNDGLVIISAPIHEARLVYIPTDAHIRLTFINKQEGLLGFNAVVKERDMHGNISVLLIEPVSGIEKIQRRMYYRLEIALNALILPDGKPGKPHAVQGKEEAKPVNDADFTVQKPIAATTKNISGSGMCLVTDADIPKDSTIKVELELSGLRTISAECKVLRNIKFFDDKGKRYELGLCFTKITKKDQESLVKYIYMQQRERLKQKNLE